jgi:branched-chain amino acid transport system substrate-binding protein
LKDKVEGVVTVYNKPFNKDDHEAITPNIPVIGEVKGGRVVYAYEEDQKKGSDIRTKQTKK